MAKFCGGCAVALLTNVTYPIDGDPVAVSYFEGLAEDGCKGWF
jgi:hypothetical protein